MDKDEVKNQQEQTDVTHESQEVTTPFEKLATSEAVGGVKELSAVVGELRSLQDHQTDLITQLLAELSSAEKENLLLKAQVSISFQSLYSFVFFIHIVTYMYFSDSNLTFQDYCFVFYAIFIGLC